MSNLSLLDKVGRAVIGDFKWTIIIWCEESNWRAPHETIYGHKKKVCLVQNISIGSFQASFHKFHNVSKDVKCEMTTPASNGTAEIAMYYCMHTTRVHVHHHLRTATYYIPHPPTPVPRHCIASILCAGKQCICIEHSCSWNLQTD